jgi:hypothetical protein
MLLIWRRQGDVLSGRFTKSQSWPAQIASFAPEWL